MVRLLLSHHLDISMSGYSHKTAFPSFEWMEFYGVVEEAIPPGMPPPLGKDVDLCMMVDSDHAGEKRTRHSHTRYIILQLTPYHLAIKAASDY